MAKTCMYCGQLLAKEDARFCNDCGRSQVAPASTSSGAAAPVAIKVKLPPKEFTRAESLSARQGKSVPGPAGGAAPVPPLQHEPATPPVPRPPKRPARLTSQGESVVGEKAGLQEDALTAMERLSGSVQPSAPTPAEEASTMVLPNWREELARLRQEQEQAGAIAPAPPEKKVAPEPLEKKATPAPPEKRAERTVLEPPPLPRRTRSTPPPPREIGHNDAQATQLRPPAQTFAQATSPEYTPRDNARSAAPTSRAPYTPVPPQERAPQTEAVQYESHMKVWEQEAPVNYPQERAEKQEPGPAPAVEQIPFASVTFGVEEAGPEIEDLETVHWQTPLSPFPASPSRPADNQPPVKEEKRPAVREESQAPAQDEPRPLAVQEKQPPGKNGSRPPVQAVSQPPLPEKARPLAQEEKGQPGVQKRKDAIEDLPTAKMAVPEVAKPEVQIKIERASTPAPQKWTAPPAEEVADQPTRPMPASPGGLTGPRGPQLPAQGEERGPGPGLVDVAPPFAQRSANPFPAPGTAPAAPPGSQTPETAADPFAARGRPTYPNSQPGPGFNPSSLPPLPGPLSQPGNIPPRPDAPGLQRPQPRPTTPSPDSPRSRPPQGPGEPFGQRPPLPGPLSDASASAKSVPADVPKKIAEADASAVQKPRKKKRTGRTVVIVLLLLVLLSVGAGVALNWDWVAQFFASPAVAQPYQTYQNSSLGVSLAYTQGWSVSVDQAHGVVQFADGTHTGQARLTVTAASGLVNAYLTQQITQQGITGAKTASAATIAGASWQVVQGTVAQSGATYTVVLYATQHNNRFYLLEFLAPQPAFTSIDQSSFAHMRSTFNFTS